MTRKYRSKTRLLYVDVSLLFPALILAGIGVAMVYSASSHIAAERFGNGAYFLKRQVLYVALGAGLMVFLRYFPYRAFRAMAYFFLLLSFVLLGALYVKGIGYTAGGATRWLHIGPFSFQPSVFATFSLIVYLSYSLSKKKENVEDFAIGFLPHVVVFIILSLLVVMEPDFGTVMILGVITSIMLFAAGVRMMHLLASCIFLLPVVVYYMFAAQYRVHRLISFLDPWQYRNGSGYQIVHSLMAFGTGGIWGTGLGQGYQKLFYLPEPHTDFIFSVIGEELGLCGVIAIMFLYFVILWRGIVIARKADDLFASLLALGLTSAIGLQVFVNTGVALGILPAKGLTLPFLSYGGTSLLFNMGAIGILMNIGQRCHDEEAW